jgi:hypothetical protein
LAHLADERRIRGAPFSARFDKALSALGGNK